MKPLASNRLISKYCNPVIRQSELDSFSEVSSLGVLLKIPGGIT